MHFYKHRGKQVLDLRGDFILTKRDELVTAVASSAAPKRVRFARYIPLKDLKFWGKVRATWRAIQFIWTEGNV